METGELRRMPLTTLFSRLQEQFSRLIRQEFSLVRTELTATVARAGKAVALLVAGAYISVFFLFSLMLGAIYGLAQVMPLWGAALIVAAVFAGGASICAIMGIRALRKCMKPSQAVHSIEEDLRWVAIRATSARQ